MRVTEVAAQLAQAIVRDGEGATKFITIRVEGGRSADECRQVALRDRALAAGEDGILRVGPESRPHPRAPSAMRASPIWIRTSIDLYLDDVLVAKAAGAIRLTARRTASAS